MAQQTFVVKFRPEAMALQPKIFVDPGLEKELQPRYKKLPLIDYYEAILNTGERSAEQFVAELRSQKAESNLIDYIAPARFKVTTAYLEDAAPPPSPDWNFRKVGAPSLAELGQLVPPQPIIVAVVDSGIDYKHDYLKGAVWKNWLEIQGPPGQDNDGNGFKGDKMGAEFNGGYVGGEPLDDEANGHGTHSAGLIGAYLDDTKWAGVAARVATVQAVKFLDHDNTGTTTDAIRAIDYAVRTGARILNLSWGIDATSMNNSERRELKDCLDAVAIKYPNVLFVAAAGNLNRDIAQPGNGHFPASFGTRNMIVVGASNPDDGRYSGTNFSNALVEIAAPGALIKATNSSESDWPDITFNWFNGTSAAVPHVSAALALLIAKHPGWTGPQLKEHLLRTADVIEALKPDVRGGLRLNIQRALATP